MKRLVALLLIAASPVQAQVTYLEAGKPAPYSGYLFTVEKEQELRLLDGKLELCVSKADLLMKSFDIQNGLIDIGNKRLVNHQEQIDSLNKQIIAYKGDDFWKSALYFLSGVVITGAISVALAVGYGQRR